MGRVRAERPRLGVIGNLAPMHRAARVGTWVGGGVVVLAMSKVHARYVADPPYDFTGSSRFAWAIGYAVLLGLAAYSLGLPDQTRRTRDAATRSIAAPVLAALGVSVVQLMVGDALLPRFVVFGSVVVVAAANCVLAAASRAGRSRGAERDRVLVVAEADERERLAIDVTMAPERPVLVVAGLIPAVAASEDCGLMTAVAEWGATVVVLDVRAQADAAIVAQAARLHESGVRVRTVFDFYEQWLGKLPLSELARTSLFFDISEVHGGSSYARVKRLMDIAIASVGVVALVVVLPVVVLGNLVGNRGPLMYRQQRVGKGGKLFTILKFRTMADLPPGSSEAGGSSWTQPDDPRVTRFGRFLRSSHLDELPQVLNIVRGDLSVVGPRPEQPHYVEELGSSLAFYDMRHLVRPGLTGWAQVKYGYAGDEHDALEKLQYEFYYLRHQDFALDLRTIARTLRSVVGGSGR